MLAVLSWEGCSGQHGVATCSAMPGHGSVGLAQGLAGRQRARCAGGGRFAFLPSKTWLDLLGPGEGEAVARLSWVWFGTHTSVVFISSLGEGMAGFSSGLFFFILFEGSN